MRRRAFVGALVGAAGLGLSSRAGIRPRAVADRVLELFAYGGLNPFDTLYTHPDWGRDAGWFAHAFEVAARAHSCADAPRLFTPFATDARGRPIFLGPWAAPLATRPDILDRMRLVVLRHDQFPHETAIPLTLTGRALGRQMRSPGAMIGAALDRPVDAPPPSWVVHTRLTSELGQNLAAATITGDLPTRTQPLLVRVDDPARLHTLFERTQAGDPSSRDAVLDEFAADYGARFVSGPPGALQRWQQTRTSVRGAPTVAPLLAPEAFALGVASRCDTTAPAYLSVVLRTASRLLSPAGADARHVLAMDGGLQPHTDGGHDTHRDHLAVASVNAPHLFQTLADHINRPGEADPEKIDLDTTTVILHSEFGRTPWPENDTGLGHWPHGYVAAVIGGDVVGRTIFGHIDPKTGVADEHSTPARLRAATLMAAGVPPIAAGAFRSEELGAVDPSAAIARIRREYWGVG